MICEVACKIILKGLIKRFAAFLTVSKLKGHIASEKKYNKLTRGSVSVVLSDHEKQKLFGDFFLFKNELGKKKKQVREKILFFPYSNTMPRCFYDLFLLTFKINLFRYT